MKSASRFAAFPPPDFRILFESVPGFYLVLARDLTIIAASDAYLRLTGTEREITVGRKLSSVFSDTSNPFSGFARNLTTSVQQVRDTGAADAITLPSCPGTLREDGSFEQRFWSFINTPILHADGSTAWIIHRAEDVTELIRLQHADREREGLGEELAGLYEKSRELDRLKTSFFANVSYEFRTGLESILGLVEDARSQTDRVFKADDLRTVHFNTLRLMNLTNSLLDFATAEGMPVQGASNVEKLNGPLHILVVDDNPAICTYLAGLLSPEFHVSVAENGDAALAAVRIDRPDLILSDVTMPVIDGISLVRSLKDDPETSSIPIILHSADECAPEHCVKGVEAGADDYLPKSVSARELLSRVRTHLDMAQAHRARAAAAQEIAVSRPIPGTFEAEVTASHRLSLDIPAPPHIAGLINMLERNFGIILDLSGRRYLSSLDAGKMDSLIDVLLSFSRMNRSEMRKVPIDLRSLVEAVIDQQIGENYPGPPTQWIVGDLPCIRADAAMLRVVLDNLVSNALKFSSQCSERRIEISAADSGAGNVLFYVRDNGTGFDMKYADRLFGVFHRLHPEENFEGSGIGLAIVRRIIQKHDGHVWATGTLGRGATFYCSLPTATGN